MGDQDTTTVAVSKATKQQIDDAAETAFGTDGVTYDAAIAYITNYYRANA